MSVDLADGIRIDFPEFPEFAYGTQRQRLAPVVHDGVLDPEGLTGGLVLMEGSHSAEVHLHKSSPIMVFFHEGVVASLVGETMEPLLHAPGSVVWIGSGIPHVGVNLDPIVEASLFEARTDPGFNDDVELRPDLNGLVAERVADLQLAYARGVFAEQLLLPTVHRVFRKAR